MEVPWYSNESFQTGKRTKSSQDSNLTLSPSCFKQEHHTFIYEFLPFVFFTIQQNQVRPPMYMQKLLLALLCGQCWLHVSLAMSLSTYWIHRDQHLESSVFLATQTQQKVQSSALEPQVLLAQCLLSSQPTQGMYSLLCQNIHRHSTCPRTVHLSAHRGEELN